MKAAENTFSYFVRFLKSVNWLISNHISFHQNNVWVLKAIPEMICRNTHVYEICNCLWTTCSWHILKGKPNMKMCHLQLLHTFRILEKYWTNRSQSRFKNGCIYLNALYITNPQNITIWKDLIEDQSCAIKKKHSILTYTIHT